MEHHEHDVYDLGLAADLQMLKRSPIQRRHILKLGLAGIGLLLVGHETLSAQTEATTSAYLPLVMKPAATNTPTTTSVPTTTATSAPTSGPTSAPTATAVPGVCVSEIPPETNGPYPADGSNQSLNALTRSGIVRSDIRTSISHRKYCAGRALDLYIDAGGLEQ